jgi:protein O-GlcNAcase/histone acetyltransferase
MSPKPTVSSLIIDEDSQDSISESQTSTASSKIHIMECDGNGNLSDLTIDDIRLLVELFYLPYEHGPNAQQMFIDFYWLRYNYSRNEKLNEWRCRASSFHNNTKNISRLVQRLTTIHNRSLLYDVYHYVNDINSTITLCSRYLHWIGKINFVFI